MGEPFHNICVNWDFDEQSKLLYFNSTITGTGQNIYLCLQNSSKPFYEISGEVETNIYISEAETGKAIFLECITTPFLYIKNIGQYNLILNASNCTGDPTGSGYFSLNTNIENCLFSGILSNYVISPNENVLIGINSSQDGTRYFSQGFYPFGFFYNFSGIKDINPNGEYPSLCSFYQDSPNIGGPTYSYDFYGSNQNVLDESNCNSLIIAQGDYLGKLVSSSPYQDKLSYCFDSNKTLTCIYSLFIDDSGMFCAERNYIYTQSSSGFYLGSGDHTAEIFVKINCVVTDDYDGNNFFALGTDNDYPGLAKIGITNLAGCVGYLNGYNGYELYGSCVSTGEWHHVAITKKDDLHSLWLDGALQSSGYSGASLCSCVELMIGGMNAGNRIRPFNGCLSNFRIVTGEALYTGTGYAVPNDNLNYSGYGSCTQLSSGNTILLYFTGENLVDPIFCCQQNPNFRSGNLFYKNFKISEFSSNLIVENSCFDNFLLTGNNFTIEAIVNQKVNDGTIVSNGGGIVGSGCSGDLYNLYIKCDCLIFDWINLCCVSSSGKNYIYKNILESANWSGLGNWNYISVSSSGNCINLWINGVSEASKTLTNYDFSGLNSTGKLLIGGMHSSGLYLDGKISNIRITNNCAIINPNCSSICNVLDYISHQCYWTGITGTVLLLNFNKLSDPIENIKSYNLDKIVDHCVHLNLKTNSYGSSICDGFSKDYYFGKNLFKTNICVNYVSLISTDCNTEIACQDLTGVIFSTRIEKDCKINLYYNIDLINEKYLNYKYFYSGESGDSNQSIVTNNLCKLCFNENCILETGQVYNFSGNSTQNFYLEFNLNQDFSLVDLITKDVFRCNMYLPPIQEFNYSYCYLLGDLNTNKKTGISGCWSTGCNIDYGLDFENFSKIESSTGNNYLNNSSCIYCVEVDVSENRFNTSSIQQKNKILNSEFFVPYFSSIEECYTYSGVEFRYFPVESISYLNQNYEIPNCCINITLGISGKQISFDFPIRALSLDKLKIINNYETIEHVENACAFSSYGDGNLNFNLNCNNSNYMQFKFLKIRNSNLTGLESPIINLNLNTNICIQNNLKFIIDPYCNIQNDKTYGLNNLLFFISSELNSGVVYQSEYTGLSYNSSNYNLLMIDLQDEFFECNFSIPTGSGYFVFDERISFQELSFNNLIPYKNISGDGYNYILPISTGFNFFDCTNDFSGIICNKFIFSGSSNDLFTGIRYSGGDSGVCSLLDESGNITGYYTGYFTNSSLSIFKNNYSINLNSQDIYNTETGRLICFEKTYTFSGIQPIYLCSNYPFLDIKYPLLTKELTQYDAQNELYSGIFYYVYDINNFCQYSLKVLSPEFTQIESIVWSDSENLENNLNYLENQPKEGQIIGNASLLKFKSTGLFNNNKYYYNFDDIKFICFNVLGGL
jgi:hypothetical protein